MGDPLEEVVNYRLYIGCKIHLKLGRGGLWGRKEDASWSFNIRTVSIEWKNPEVTFNSVT